jgi:integron integrase
MSEEEVESFLSYLANEKKVSASTQNQALCALVFLYRNVMQSELVNLKYGYSKAPKRLPVVLNSSEISKIIDELHGVHKLIAGILYGSGLRINEALTLRIKDIDFTNHTIFVFRGKGQKDRVSMLPKQLTEALQEQILKVKKIHARDIEQGYGKKALKDLKWHYIFPSTTRCQHPVDGYICRHHLHSSAFRKALRVASLRADIHKQVRAHTFRHSFATQMLKSGTDIRTLQELMGHSDIRTTELYTHVIGEKLAGSISPFDQL